MEFEKSNFNSYADVFVLNEDQLRIILLEGDEPAQVWASWALGVKLKEHASPPEVRQLISSEPAPGVRQNLLVFLAGNGEYNLMEKYARSDPNSNVRAAACSLLGRFAKDVSASNELLDELLQSDKSNEVRATILVSAARDGRPVALPALESVIVSRDQELQQRALKVVAATQNCFEITNELIEGLLGWAGLINCEIFERYCRICYEIGDSGSLITLAQERCELAFIPLNILVQNGFKSDLQTLQYLAAEVG